MQVRLGDVPKLLIWAGRSVIVSRSKAEAKSARFVGRRGAHGGRSRSRAVSALSGERGREIWDRQQWQGALSVSAGGHVRADVSADVGLSGMPARGEAAKSREDAEWEWDSG